MVYSVYSVYRVYSVYSVYSVYTTTLIVSLLNRNTKFYLGQLTYSDKDRYIRRKTQRLYRMKGYQPERKD